MAKGTAEGTGASDSGIKVGGSAEKA
jgi:hypothetical protein